MFYKSKSKIDFRQKALSKMQRLRVLEESSGGYGKCITCGKIYPIALLDGGHYISRSHKITELERDNINPQCQCCNRFKNGDPIVYRKKLIEKIGEDRVARLETLLNASKGSDKEFNELNRCDKRKIVAIKNYETEYRKLCKEYNNMKKIKGDI